MGFFDDALGGLTGGLIGTDFAGEAADRQERSGREAVAFGAEQIGPFRDIGIAAGEQLAGAQFQPGFEGFNRDPSRILNNPLFQALAKQQEQRLINQQGALGRGGSGETNDLLTQNLMLLGQDFQQQDIANQQTEFQNRLSENQLRFGQLFDQTRLGANAASQQATSGQNIIQGMGNAQAAGLIGRQNNISGFFDNAIAVGGMLLGGAGGAGAGAGGIPAGLGSGGGAMSSFSDVRLKDNIRYEETIDGFDFYSWSWNDEAKELVGDQVPYGVLAQDIRESVPYAVTSSDGYLQVDYEALACH